MLTWIVLGTRPRFPAGVLRGALSRAVPKLRWTCGEDDDGTPDCAAPMRRDTLITGRSGTASVQIALHAEDRTEDGVQLQASVMGCDDTLLRDRILTALAGTFATLDRPGMHVRFAATQGWLNAAGAERAAVLVLEGEELAAIAPALAVTHEPMLEAIEAPTAAPAPSPSPAAQSGTGGPSQLAHLPFDDLLPQERSARMGIDVIGLAETEASVAHALFSGPRAAMADTIGWPEPPPFFAEAPRRDRLPTLVLLFDEAPRIDWSIVAEGLTAIDGEAEWRIHANSPHEARLTGRGGTICLSWQAEALPAWMIEKAIWRSFWCRPGSTLRRLRRHRGYLSLTCDLDTAAAEYIDVRQSAKALSMVLAIAAKSGPCTGVFNAAHGCAYTADQLDMLVGPLAEDEVPIKLFLWTAFHETKGDAVSLSTAGMLPFVGREVETWNAPGSLAYVGDKLNQLLRYLLIEGPVIRHGDTIGETAGEQTLRVCHGESREASRPGPVPVLLMEFAGPANGTPRPDPVPIASAPTVIAPPPAVNARTGFGSLRRTTGNFGRKGL